MVSSSGLPSAKETCMFVQRHTGENQVKGHKDNEGTGASLLWANAESWDFSACRRLRVNSSMCSNTWRSVAKRIEPGSFQGCPGPELFCTNWNTGSSIWTSVITFSLRGWLSTGTGCPEWWRSLHPWSYSKAAWTESWAVCCSHAWPGRLDQMTSRGVIQFQMFRDLLVVRCHLYCIS